MNKKRGKRKEYKKEMLQFVIVKEFIHIFYRLYVTNMSCERSKVSRQDLRVLVRNMIYCSGVPSNLTSDELKSESYFGKYGSIQKIILSPYPNRSYCSVYITYSHQFQAATAILSCNEFQLDQSTLWCLFGTMKYCRFFLKKIQCKNIPNCPYLHLFDKKNEIQIKTSPSEAFPQHQQLAIQILNKYPQKVKKLMSKKIFDQELPSSLAALDYLDINEPQQIDENIETTMEQSQSKKEQMPEEQKQKTHRKFSLETRIKRMILNQISRNKGSRLVKQIKEEQENIKEIIISGLSK